MEPIPESIEAVDEFGPFSYDGDLLEELKAKAAAVLEIVPDCVGLSLAVIADGFTLTLVASGEEVAVLDAIQYLAGGPCVDGAKGDRVLESSADSDVTDELGWQLFARASAASSVLSTLTLPVLVDDRVAGSVNLYAASANAFTGHHEEIARIFDAWAPGAVTNADLSFTTRRTAEEAPRQLHAAYRAEVAASIVAVREGLDMDEARVRLREAARRAGVDVAQLAETLIALDRDERGS